MWLKLDDKWSEQPRLLNVGPEASWLHLRAMMFCAEYLTDGEVPKAFASGPLVDALLDQELWIDKGDHYYLPEYLLMNRSAAQQKELSSKRSDAGSKGADSRWSQIRTQQRPKKSKARAKANAMANQRQREQVQEPELRTGKGTVVRGAANGEDAVFELDDGRRFRVEEETAQVRNVETDEYEFGANNPVVAEVRRRYQERNGRELTNG